MTRSIHGFFHHHMQLPTLICCMLLSTACTNNRESDSKGVATAKIELRDDHLCLIWGPSDERAWLDALGQGPVLVDSKNDYIITTIEGLNFNSGEKVQLAFVGGVRLVSRTEMKDETWLSYNSLRLPLGPSCVGKTVTLLQAGDGQLCVLKAEKTADGKVQYYRRFGFSG